MPVELTLTDDTPRLTLITARSDSDPNERRLKWADADPKTDEAKQELFFCLQCINSSSWYRIS
jgi:hypothetical protein